MLVLIDGNSILNRAFYGIMGNKMLTTPDGKYTNAVYGFLAIMFKTMDDLQPEYIAVAFDLKAPTQRHKLYEGYKATRKGMPNELAEQMPIIKEILRMMNITIIEKEGYEADDILGTLAKKASKQGINVTILSGDRDTFQLASDKISIRIPHTKMGKTETDTFGEAEIIEKYGVKPKQLIEVKGLMGDSSDNIPGVPGVGEKTAIDLIKKYNNIDKLYETIEKDPDIIKGKLKEKLVNNKDLAMLSRTLGTINIEVPIEEKISELQVKEWENDKVLEIFKNLKFNRFIERFKDKFDSVNSDNNENKNIEDLFTIEELKVPDLPDLIKKIKEEKEIIYLLGKKENNLQNELENNNTNFNIINKSVTCICIYREKENKVYYIKLNDDQFVSSLSSIFEDNEIKKYGYKLREDYVLLRQLGVRLNNIYYDAEIATYDLNQTMNNYTIENISSIYLNINVSDYLSNYEEKNKKNEQITLFQNDEEEESEKYINCFYTYLIKKLYDETIKKLQEVDLLDLFNNIEMPLVKVLGEMQYNGMRVDEEELVKFGEKLKIEIEDIRKQIYELCGEEFNINSTQQLGKILFEKLELPVYKKTKKGYSTDVDILEKLRDKHPVIEKILEYRSLVKLNSTYVEGMLPYINKKTGRIHSHFHQTITATR